MPALLAIDDLHVSFASDRGRTGILHGISLELEPGQTIGVVGESGSGKTVLVRAVLGLLDAPFGIDGGRIEYEGANLLDCGERELERIRGRNIALTTPEPRKHLNPLTTIGDQIAKVIRAHSDIAKEAAMARAVELLGLVGIPDPELRLAGYPHEMSGGMCQRIIIAMALAHDSRILLIDEPTAGLDVTISRQILDLVRGLVRDRGVAALIVSRDLGVVAHYCRDVAVMYAGRIVERAAVETFFRRPVDPYSARLLRAAAAARDHAVARSEATALLPRAAEPHLQTHVLRGGPGSGGAGVGPPRPVPKGPGDRERGSRGLMSSPLLAVEGLVKHFPMDRRQKVQAVNDVSFEIGAGEALALVGESGSGKTTTGRCILRLLEPTAGAIRFDGMDLMAMDARSFRALRPRIQMVFQEPYDSLSPRMRIGAIVEEPLKLAGGVGPAERQERVAEILELVRLGAGAMHRYPHQFSAGQQQRIGIARALATRPDLVVLDEPTSALDVSVRAEVLDLLSDLRANLGVSYLFISHDLTAVRRVCDRVAIMYLGKIVETGETEAIFERPLHPYSRALLSSVLYPDPEVDLPRFALEGEIPSPINLPPGCHLHRRCPWAETRCEDRYPDVEWHDAGRAVSCHRAREMAAS